MAVPLCAAVAWCKNIACWVHGEGRDNVPAGFCHQHENEPRKMQMDGSESPNSPKDHLHPLWMPQCCLLAEEQEIL